MKKNEYKVEVITTLCSILSHAECSGSFLAHDKSKELHVCSNCSWAKLHILKKEAKKKYLRGQEQT